MANLRDAMRGVVSVEELNAYEAEIAQPDPDGGSSETSGITTSGARVDIADTPPISGQVLIASSPTAAAWTTPAFGNPPLTVEDEGTPLTASATKLNFVGPNVTVTQPVPDEMLVTLSDAPGTHATGHQNGGGDEISVAGLSGVLADNQPTAGMSAGVLVDDTAHGTRGGGTTHAAAVAGVSNGFITAADQSKLDGIAPSANNYAHPNHTGDVTSTGDGAQAIAAGAVTNAKLASMAQALIKGRSSGAGAGDPEDLTAAQATAILDAFTDSLKGLAPASGGGTDNFLRADGAWGVPPGVIVQQHGGLSSDNNATGQTLTLQSTYYAINTWQTVLPELGCTGSITSDDLTIALAGTYLVLANISFEGTVGQNYGIEAHLNGSRTNITSRTQLIDGAQVTDVGNLSLNAIIVVGAGDVMDLRAICHTAAGTVFRVRDGSFTVLKIA